MTYIFDGINKLITMTSSTLSVLDVYSRWIDWYFTDDNSKYAPAFRYVGGDSIDELAGTSIPIYLFLENGWKIKPKEENHTLSVISGILLTSDGSEPFANTVGTFNIRIKYSQPVQAITVNTAGSVVTGGLTEDEAKKLDEMHKLQGLDTQHPLLVTPTAKIVDGIVLDIIRPDGGSSVIVSRQLE